VVLEPRRLAGKATKRWSLASSRSGIGKWSAEMFLRFQLRRLDVWPTGDLGVRKGLVGLGVPAPTPKQLDALGEPYHPYRSIVAWYCWRATQLYAVPSPPRSPPGRNLRPGPERVQVRLSERGGVRDDVLASSSRDGWRRPGGQSRGSA